MTTELCKLELKRNGGLFLFLQTDSRFEDFFASKSTGQRQSRQWQSDSEALSFYQVELQGDCRRFIRNEWLDAYGDKFIDGDSGKPNIAIFRTVGITRGIRFKLNDDYSEETLQKAMEELKRFVVKFYKQFVRNVSITITLTSEETV